MLDVDCDTIAGDWDEQTDWPALARTAIAAALVGAGHGAVVGDANTLVEVAVRLTDDAEVQALNRDYRHKDRPTNVLSFPMLDPAAVDATLRTAKQDILLGDIAIAHETVLAEAAAKGISITDHVTHLIVHGTLHLLGMDHLDDTEAEAMEALEVQILATLGLADPYAGGEPAPASGARR